MLRIRVRRLQIGRHLNDSPGLDQRLLRIVFERRRGGPFRQRRHLMVRLRGEFRRTGRPGPRRSGRQTRGAQRRPAAGRHRLRVAREKLSKEDQWVNAVTEKSNQSF